MKNLWLIALIICPSFLLADENDDKVKLMNEYRMIDPQGAQQLIGQMVARQLGLQPPSPEPQVVYQPVYVPQQPRQPTVFEQLREQQKATYTNCEEKGGDIDCISQTH